MADTQPPWPQEIRIAMTMVGGSSLAVWMGGVTAEVSELLRASRDRDAEGPYQQLLRLLDATVSVDVLTGTSAGGINAACLGLAEAYHSSPDVLRDTWLTTGSLLDLLRDPAERTPSSLLDGDRVLLGGLEDALAKIVTGGHPPAEPCDITVLLTATMIDGENFRFNDALGNLIHDHDHRLLFRFDGPQWNGEMLRPLALAARATASFPGAFELSYLPIGNDGAGHHGPDLATYTTAIRSHWLTDGGVLVNKPIRPALREIFERTADMDVRRLLLYVVPTGEEPPSDTAPDPGKPPLLGNALGKVVLAVMNQSISAELEDIGRHNAAVDRARSTRVSLAAIALRSGPETLVSADLMEEYRDRRVQDDAMTLVREATRLLDGAGARWAAGTDKQLLETATAALYGRLPTLPPGEDPTDDQLRDFRTTALDDAVATGLQLVNAGFRLGPDRAQADTLNAGRAALHRARVKAGRQEHLVTWVNQREPPQMGTALTDWIRELADEWAASGRNARVGEGWTSVADTLRRIAPVLRDLAATTEAEPPSTELKAGRESSGKTITTLTNWLGLTDLGGVSSAAVCGRLLTLHIATRGLLAQPPSVDQKVDLVQVSADSRTVLDLRRQRATQKLTAIQAGHFGAFYKSSWRANDWMWGRVDTAGWLMQCLLDPTRLRYVTPDAVASTFRSVGWQPPRAEDGLTTAEVREFKDQLNEELGFLGLDADLGPAPTTGELPASMPVTAMVLARSRQLTIAREELTVVAQQAREDADVAKGNGKPSQDFRKLMRTPPRNPDEVQRAFQECQVSAETLAGERGSTLLTTTLVKAGATGINAVACAGRLPTAVRPVARFAQATGRSAWWVARGAAKLRAPWNLLAALIAALAGLVLGDHSGPFLQGIGLLITAGALLFLFICIFTLGRRGKGILSALAAALGVCLLSAAFVPPIRELLFPWLITLMKDWQQGRQTVWWVVVSAFLLLPAVATPITTAMRAIAAPRKARRLRATAHLQGRLLAPTALTRKADPELPRKSTRIPQRPTS